MEGIEYTNPKPRLNRGLDAMFPVRDYDIVMNDAIDARSKQRVIDSWTKPQEPRVRRSSFKGVRPKTVEPDEEPKIKTLDGVADEIVSPPPRACRRESKSEPRTVLASKPLVIPLYQRHILYYAFDRKQKLILPSTGAGSRGGTESVIAADVFAGEESVEFGEVRLDAPRLGGVSEFF